MLKNHHPMDRFIDKYDRTFEKFTQRAETTDPANYDDQVAFTRSAIELQSVSGAVTTALNARHGLLKKIISEIR